MLFGLFFSAVGAGMFSDAVPFGSASVLVFLSAVIGIVTTGAAMPAISRQSGGSGGLASPPSAGVASARQLSPTDPAKL